MADPKWTKIETIIDEALSLPESKRRKFIDRTCGEDIALKTEITLLLESIFDSEGWLENPGDYKDEFYQEAFDNPEAFSPGSSLIGKQVGAYRILELLGEGGMGLVYLAKRMDGSFEHRVALKVLREGMDTEHNILRFRQERTILAGLNHSNIAGILDGGVTDNGLPYLIMEYVDGNPIDAHCDINQFTIGERIELFKFICRAVQHAHNNLVIHRDLKPDNILVDTKGNIKILDFGIAKLLSSEHVGKNMLLQTRTGARILTVGYAAPEQITGKPITTSVDNYTLGTLLYTLLTGVLPFDKKNKSIQEIENLITHTIPPKPSERFENLPKGQKEKICRHMRSTPSGIKQTLRGDLDAIIMKSLRKEPGGRYNSPNQMMEDLNRFENGLPVTAREDTVRYHVSKFVNRHKTGITGAVVSLLTLLGIGLFYTHQITQERNKAQLEAEKASQITDFIVDLFGRSNPYFDEIDGGLDLKIGSVLRYGSGQIDKELSGQPEVRAELKTVIGEVYSQLGEFGAAETLLTEAIDIRKNLTETTLAERAESMKPLAFLYQEQGNFDKAESMLKKIIEVFEGSEAGLENETAASAMARLGNLLWFNKGDYETSGEVLHRALELRRKIHTNDHAHIATNLNDLATLYHAQGSYEKATPYYEKSISMYRHLSDEHSNLAIIMSNFSALLRETGAYEKAEKIQREALDMHIDLTGEQSIDVALGLGNLGHIFLEKEEFGKADSLLEISKNKLQKIYGDQHPYISRTKLNMGRLHLRQKQFTEAESLLKQANKEFHNVYPENHPRTSDPLLEIGILYLDKNFPEKAMPYLKKAYEIRSSGYPADSWRVAQTMSVYGSCLSITENFSKADSMLVNGYELLKETRGSTDAYTKNALERLTIHYRYWDKPEKIKQYLHPSSI